MSEVLLEARNLNREFPAGRKKKIHAVSDVSLRICEGETLGLVGESGCGKSTLGRLLIRLIEPDSGEVLVRGKPVTGLKEKEFSSYRRKFQLIFQDPYASLNPRMTVRDLIAEPLKTYKVCESKEETTERVLELMKAVGVPGEFLHRYRHQFSGGQRQRIGIARAIAADPESAERAADAAGPDLSVYQSRPLGGASYFEPGLHHVSGKDLRIRTCGGAFSGSASSIHTISDQCGACSGPAPAK